MFLFNQPILTLTRAHVIREKPNAGKCPPHPSDAGKIDQAAELTFGNFVKIATATEDFVFPP